MSFPLKIEIATKINPCLDGFCSFFHIEGTVVRTDSRGLEGFWEAFDFFISKNIEFNKIVNLHSHNFVEYQLFYAILVRIIYYVCKN